MMDGFNLDSPLVCEGIIGDGCGGGRIFFVEGETLFAYDPMTQERRVLKKNLHNIIEISKKRCIISLVSQEESVAFDLSKL